MLAGLDAAATAAGLYPGLPLADAKAILPRLETVTGDPAGDAKALNQLAGWCNRYSPWTTPETPLLEAIDGAGALWLDVSGCAHLFGGEAALLCDLIDRLVAAGHAARAGLANTPGAAWAAARFAPDAVADEPGATIVPEGGGCSFLAPLPVAALRIAPETVTTLDALGLRSIATLLDLPRASLTERFGDTLVARLDAALGIVGEPLSPNTPRSPHFARLGFAEPIATADNIASALERLLADLASGLARRERAQGGWC